MEETVLKDMEVLISTMSSFPGFGFSPTDVELLEYYLKKKLQGYNDYILIIPELEINKFEPWDLPGRALIQSSREWFYFNPRGKRYPQGSRNTRRTELGYWKPTGIERPVRAKYSSKIIGKKRTLVFHTGRAPKGVRTVWIMHELSMIGYPKDSMSVCRLVKNTDSSAKDPKPIRTFVPEWKINDLTYYNNPDAQMTSTNSDSAAEMLAESSDDDDKSITLTNKILNQFAVDQLLQLPSYPNSSPLGTCSILEINEIEEIPMEIFQRSLHDALKRRYISNWPDEAGPSGYNYKPDLEHETPPDLEHETPPELELEPKGKGKGKGKRKRKVKGKKKKKVTKKENGKRKETEKGKGNSLSAKKKDSDRHGNGKGKGKGVTIMG